MSDILCVTNRKLCREDFLIRIEKIASAHPSGIMLREKDLDEAEYMNLARDVIKICKRYDIPCILHTFTEVAKELNSDALHLPLNILRTLSEKEKSRFSVLGVSCHSVEDAIYAQKQDCSYITVGHIFDTDCKKGLPGRGLEFLKSVCESVSIPVYAIGGITPDNICDIRKCGAYGACVMSGLMICDNVDKYLGELK